MHLQQLRQNHRFSYNFLIFSLINLLFFTGSIIFNNILILNPLFSLPFTLLLPGLLITLYYGKINQIEGLEIIILSILFGFAYQILISAFLTALNIFLTRITLYFSIFISNEVVLSIFIKFLIKKYNSQLDILYIIPNLKPKIKISWNEVLLFVYLILCGFFVNVKFPFTYVEDQWFHLHVLQNALANNSLNLPGYRGYFGLTSIMLFLNYSISTDLIVLAKWVYPILAVLVGGGLLKYLTRILLNNSNWSRLVAFIGIIFPFSYNNAINQLWPTSLGVLFGFFLLINLASIVKNHHEIFQISSISNTFLSYFISIPLIFTHDVSALIELSIILFISFFLFIDSRYKKVRGMFIHAIINLIFFFIFNSTTNFFLINPDYSGLWSSKNFFFTLLIGIIGTFAIRWFNKFLQSSFLPLHQYLQQHESRWLKYSVQIMPFVFIVMIIIMLFTIPTFYLSEFSRIPTDPVAFIFVWCFLGFILVYCVFGVLLIPHITPVGKIIFLWFVPFVVGTLYLLLTSYFFDIFPWYTRWLLYFTPIYPISFFGYLYGLYQLKHPFSGSPSKIVSFISQKLKVIIIGILMIGFFTGMFYEQNFIEYKRNYEIKFAQFVSDNSDSNQNVILSDFHWNSQLIFLENNSYWNYWEDYTVLNYNDSEIPGVLADFTVKYDKKEILILFDWYLDYAGVCDEEWNCRSFDSTRQESFHNIDEISCIIKTGDCALFLYINN